MTSAKTANYTKEMAAMAAYEINRAYCASLGDFSFSPWDSAEEWQRQSCRDGVEFFLRNQHTITPADSHNNWLKHKRSEGWTYGETKDPVKKTHPCMLPFTELPQAQKTKDYLFLAVMRLFFGGVL